MIDIGTGAGFPGIPLKIVYPHLKVTLLDSLNKRIKFLNCVIQELSLENITALHEERRIMRKRQSTEKAMISACPGQSPIWQLSQSTAFPM